MVASDFSHWCRMAYKFFFPPGGRTEAAMPSAYTQNFYHTVFSTLHRANLIAPDVEERLYPFMGGILRDLRCTLLAINGMPDHVHLLVRYRADLSHSEMLQQVSVVRPPGGKSGGSASQRLKPLATLVRPSGLQKDGVIATDEACADPRHTGGRR
jgi:Transposase IS200 like